MRFDQVLIRCDICGREFTVERGDEGGYRHVLPTLSSRDCDMGRTKIESADLDLCPECLRKVTVVRMVVETAERYIGGHDMYGRVPNGRVKYSIIGD